MRSKVRLNFDVQLLSVGIILLKVMNGCCWEILHFVIIYFIPVAPGLAQQGWYRGRNKHNPHHNYLLFLLLAHRFYEIRYKR